MDFEARKTKSVLITVNYKSEGSVLGFLASLGSIQAISSIKIIVVDNASGDERLAGIRGTVSRIQNVELVELATNRGYFGAARFAFDRYLKQGHDLPDWVIVSNHDVLIEDEDFFSNLFSQDPTGVGILAPRITIPSQGIEQNPFMRQRPGWLRWNSLRLIYSNYGTAAMWDWFSRKKGTLKSLFGSALSRSSNGSLRREQIYAPHGAFFIFSRKYFEAGGYLDGNLFLYGEEISVAEISRSLGLAVIYEPSLCVVHNEHASTGKRITRFTYECQKNALQYLTSRYLTGSGSPVEPRTEP